ncbi:GNAT family N-acetyltransferase [Mucilaginibacter auburnensis]|uniref:Acetyltransferase (GNAT) family protein n=1 Tax=Mucilaginibacter auburnensis TaxID=1457233 RepID=A0A2H9VVH4_9SPHI|nr:GNAT family N-acetyltransferase [Mucilaginibacter auburnensis]PJJ84782.1 acetyltransferase (GNAT) family protein [Mucilaginibacter auburnensis]
MIELTVKRITANEADLVAELFDKYRIFYKQESEMALAESFINDRLSNNESVIYVALWDNKPVGFTQLYPKYSSMRAVKNWILNDLYVDEAYRNKGIASKLIQAAMDFAKANKAKFVQLETQTDNFNAQRLYESVGFIQQQPDTEFMVYRKAVDNN